jgi:phosphoribosylaminoimidazole-succinocarboxamide synthase
VAETLRAKSLKIYQTARDYAGARGILLADTKFEFGEFEGRPIVIDEVLTPDSSRFWPAAQYAPGKGQPSFDKQFVRDWLETTGWDKNSPPPALPDEVALKTRAKYIEAFELLSGRSFPWK